MSFLKNVLDKTIIKSFKLPDTLEERKKLYIFLLPQSSYLY